MKSPITQSYLFRTVVALSSALALPVSVHAQLITSDPSLPPLYPPAVYTNLAGVGPTFHGPGLTIVLQNEQHRPLGPVTRIISVGNEFENFGSDLEFTLSVNGSGFVPASATGPVSVETFGKAGNTTGTFNTEMLSMNLSGSSPFGPFMIRESPTLASTGQTTIADIGGGLYRIDSFFDVFTELSIDGGNSWIPSDSSTRVTLEPEPSTAAILGLGLLAWARLGRRQRKVC
jgi:hypothetical protein